MYFYGFWARFLYFILRKPISRYPRYSDEEDYDDCQMDRPLYMFTIVHLIDDRIPYFFQDSLLGPYGSAVKDIVRGTVHLSFLFLSILCTIPYTESG